MEVLGTFDFEHNIIKIIQSLIYDLYMTQFNSSGELQNWAVSYNSAKMTNKHIESILRICFRSQLHL